MGSLGSSTKTEEETVAVTVLSSSSLTTSNNSSIIDISSSTTDDGNLLSALSVVFVRVKGRDGLVVAVVVVSSTTDASSTYGAFAAVTVSDSVAAGSVTANALVSISFSTEFEKLVDCTGSGDGAVSTLCDGSADDDDDVAGDVADVPNSIDAVLRLKRGSTAYGTSFVVSGGRSVCIRCCC